MAASFMSEIMSRGGAIQHLLLLLLGVAFLISTSLLLVAEASGCLDHSSAAAQTCTAANEQLDVSGSRLLSEAKKQGGVRSELIHRDKLSASNATLYERIQQAIGRSNGRLKSIANKARAYSNSTAAASRLLSSFTTPVSSDQGEYLMQFQIGTPITTFHAIADTGSDLIWVQCLPCTSCYQTNDPIFDPSTSSSYATLSCSSSTCQALNGNIQCSGSQCGYVYGYGDGSSTSGDYSTETLTLSTTTGGSVALSPLAFGCGHNNAGTFSPDSGGLVGLGRGPISLISQLSSVITEKFSYCLVTFGDSNTITSPLLFGSAAALSGSGIGTTSILNGAVPTFYYVLITGIAVGGTALSIPSSSFGSSSDGTIFDSGTTLTYFESQAYQIVRSAFASRISLPTVDGSPYGLDLCYDISSNPNYQPPSFQISFSGANLTPPAANYFILADTNVLCLALGDAGASGSGNPSIVGNIMQQNYHVLYDLTISKLSFQKTTCG